MNQLRRGSSMASQQFRTPNHSRAISDNGRKNAARLPLTHFISLPIGHHKPLQKCVSSFTKELLETPPTPPGLDQSIVIPPRRLHLTLGVMSLEDSDDPNIAFDGQASNSRLTVSGALALLTSLQSQISELLCGASLKVPLHIMDIMPPDGGNPDKAHVLWLGPSHASEDAKLLRKVGDMVNKTFTDAGFITERRPLKLHCTILNTTYRKPRTRGPRQPFSYRSLLASSAAQAVLLEPSTESGLRQPANVDFGIWQVDEIQICKMGSHGPEGEYESCGGLVLSGPHP